MRLAAVASTRARRLAERGGAERVLPPSPEELLSEDIERAGARVREALPRKGARRRLQQRGGRRRLPPLPRIVHDPATSCERRGGIYVNAFTASGEWFEEGAALF